MKSSKLTNISNLQQTQPVHKVNINSEIVMELENVSVSSMKFEI